MAAGGGLPLSLLGTSRAGIPIIRATRKPIANAVVQPRGDATSRCCPSGRRTAMPRYALLRRLLANHAPISPSTRVTNGGKNAYAAYSPTVFEPKAG